MVLDSRDRKKSETKKSLLQEQEPRKEHLPIHRPQSRAKGSIDSHNRGQTGSKSIKLSRIVCREGAVGQSVIENTQVLFSKYPVDP